MLSLPERFEEFAEARRNGFVKVMELKKSGANICGTFCQYTPAEIIDAAGLYSVGLCGKSDESIPAAETRLPANLCPLIKASYGHALEQTCPYAYFSDVVCGETTCDGKKKMYEMLGELKPMQVIHLPNNPDRKRSLEAWIMELHAFKEGLENTFHVTITDDMLRASIHWCNLERIQAARIYELGKYDPPAIKGVDMRNVMEGEGYLFDKKQKYEKLRHILDECEKNWHEGKGPYRPDEHPVRIMVSGAGFSGCAEKTIHVIEELGAAVVIYEGCSGITARRRLIDEDPERDPMTCIAEKYLEVPCAVMSPNHARMKQIAATIEEWHVDGAVNITLHSCLPFGIEARNVAKICTECGVPSIHIETDFSREDAPQIRTRLEAFLEMLRQKKEAQMNG